MSCMCAICYEDVAPASELLQTIAVCGHVFHELCLQQWIEFCPNGRKPTCPLCKQNCGTKDVHRLYFQSSSDSSQKQDSLRATPSELLTPGASTTPADRARFSRLEAKVQMLTNTCQSSKEQILELEGKEARYLEQLQVLESERLKGRKEKGQLVESLARTREELRRSSESREELVERNETMAKDLAVYHLANDVNLSQEDMLRLISVDRGSANKDDIIDMMTKSLYLRNRSFKELMHKCQELGMGESRAEQKLEKLTEQLKRMKARMQELANAEEEKENAEVRHILRTSAVRARHSLSSLNDLNSAVNESDVGEGIVTPSQNSKFKNSMRKEASPIASSAFICAGSDRDASEAQARGIKENISALDVGCMEAALATRSRNGELNSTRRNWRSSSQLGTDYLAPQNAGDEFSSFRNGSLNNGDWMDEAEHRDDAQFLSVGAPAQTSGKSTGIGKSGHWSQEEGSYADVGSSGSQMRPKLTVGLDGDIDNVEALGWRPMLPIRQELGLGQGSSSFTRQQHMMGSHMPQTPPCPHSEGSTFILSGADGRGGRVTVLKPPRLVPGGSANLFGAQRAKRLKSTSHIAGGRPAALKIEHFFGPG